MQYNRAILALGMAEKIKPGTIKDKKSVDGYDALQASRISLLDIAKNRMAEAGQSFHEFGEKEIIKRAWTTTDYPVLFTESINRILQDSYETKIPEWERLTTQVKTKDFRPQKGVKVDGAVTFDYLPEGGEYKETPLLVNESAQIELKRYGRIFTLSYESLVNDDLNVLAQIPKMIDLGAGQMWARKVWELLINNANTPDGKALFHTSHNNYKATGGSIPNADSISEARTAMRRQKSPAGNILGIVPKYLIVPPELETVAERLVSEVTPNETDNVNVFAGKFEVMVCDLLEDPQAWYMAADPADMSGADGLVYAAGAGENAGLEDSISVSSFTNQSDDTLRIKANVTFGSSVWGYQGWYKNAGK